MDYYGVAASQVGACACNWYARIKFFASVVEYAKHLQRAVSTVRLAWFDADSMQKKPNNPKPGCSADSSFYVIWWRVQYQQFVLCDFMWIWCYVNPPGAGEHTIACSREYRDAARRENMCRPVAANGEKMPPQWHDLSALGIVLIVCFVWFVADTIRKTTTNPNPVN